jgi:iron complex transport system substrate-binding protein
VVLDLSFLDAFAAIEQPVVGFAGTSDQKVPSYLQDSLPGELTPMFVGERKQPNLEVILSLKPDLIVANPDRHKMIRPQLEAVAPTIALQDNSLHDVLQMTSVFSLITDRPQQAETLEKEIQERVAQAEEIQIGQPTVLVVGAFEDEFSTWTQGSFIGSLFQEVGADYAFKGQASASESQTEVAKITVESLAQLNPDFLFVYGEPARWSENPLYQNLRANEEGRMLEVDRDLWSRARGPLAAKQILNTYADFLQAHQEVAADPLQR